MARAGEWVRDALHGRVPDEPTPQEPDTQFCDLDDVSVSELGGSRPDRLFAVSGPQERVQRHTVEQMADGAPVLPMLGALVPLVAEQPVEVLKILDNSLPDVEQVIEVPKIFSDDIPSRSSVSEPQLAEQLVEVPDRIYGLAVIAVRTLGWEAAAALSRRLLLAYRHFHHPVDPSGGRHRHARAGYKYWPPRRWLTLRFYGSLFLAVT